MASSSAYPGWLYEVQEISSSCNPSVSLKYVRFGLMSLMGWGTTLARNTYTKGIFPIPSLFWSWSWIRSSSFITDIVQLNSGTESGLLQWSWIWIGYLKCLIRLHYMILGSIEFPTSSSYLMAQIAMVSLASIMEDILASLFSSPGFLSVKQATLW